MSKRSRRANRQRTRVRQRRAAEIADARLSEPVWILSRRIEAASEAGDMAALRRLAVTAMKIDPKLRTDVMRKAITTELALRRAEGHERLLERGRGLGLVPPLERGG